MTKKMTNKEVETKTWPIAPPPPIQLRLSKPVMSIPTMRVSFNCQSLYCMSKKSWSILYSKLRYKLCQDFSGIQNLNISFITIFMPSHSRQKNLFSKYTKMGEINYLSRPYRNCVTWKELQNLFRKLVLSAA